MKVPKDQGLVLAIFYSVSLAVILIAWVLLPPIVSLEEEEETEVKVLKPEEAIQNAEEILIQAETALAELEKKEKEKSKPGGGKAEKGKGGQQAAPGAAAGSGAKGGDKK